MLPEEYLTSIEVSDGLETPSQVEELITLMREETNCEAKSIVEARRHHYTVARAITKTKSSTCLDQFVKLGGLQYFNGWLNDALKSSANISGDFLEESTTLHLQALKQLHIDNEKLISSGVFDTVKSLCDHNSTIIKDTARELVSSWKDVGLSIDLEDIENVDAFGDNDRDRIMPMFDEEGTLLEGSAVDFKLTKHNRNSVETAPEKSPGLKGSDCILPEAVEDIKIENIDRQMVDPVSLDQADMVGGAISVINEWNDISEAECCVATPAEGITNVGNVNSSDVRQDMFDKKPNANEKTDNGRSTNAVDSTSDNLEVVSSKSTFNPQEFEVCSSVANVSIAAEAMPEDKSQSNMVCMEGLAPMKGDFFDDAKPVISENNRGLVDLVLQKSLLTENLERTSSTLDDLTAITAAKSDAGVTSHVNDDYSKGSAIQNLARDIKSSVVADMRSDIDLDYGIMDALEVARQVAKAVEKEMVDYRSNENKSDVSRHSATSDSINEKDSQSENLSEESSSKLEMSSEPLSEREIEVSSSARTDTKPANNMDVDQPGESTQEGQVNSKRDMCEFDLNQDATFENAEFAVNFCHSTVEENGVHSVSNATSMSPVGASQFDGYNGWKEPPATIAFLQSSPRAAVLADALACHSARIFEKQKQFSLGIDLNVAKVGENTIVNPLYEKETTSSPILPSKLFVAAGCGKSVRQEFDLNLTSDVDDAPSSSSFRFDKQHQSHFKVHPGSSSASSLSIIQPRVNIDLNERLPVQIMPSHLHPFFGMSSTRDYDAREDAKPVISIMGARVEVSRTDSFCGAPSLPNGNNVKPATEASIASMGSYLGVGPTGSHTHPSRFGYINMNTGPSVSFMPPIFRPGNTMTYMVGPMVFPVPQVAASPPVNLPTHTHPPFFTSVAGLDPNFTGVVTSGPNFDLNLGFMAEGGNRQGMASRQLFSNNQGMFIGKPLNPGSQSSSSFGKRKEPETGWETYPNNLKHHYPPGN